MQTSVFTSDRVFLFVVPPVAPFVGAGDIGQGFHRPETGNWAWESNLGPRKILCCEVRVPTWDLQNIMHTRSTNDMWNALAISTWNMYNG